MAKSESRPERWSKAVADIRAGLEALTDLKDEYQDWLDNLPENLQEGATAEKLNEVVDASFYDEIESAVDEADGIELPKGFGKD